MTNWNMYLKRILSIRHFPIYEYYLPFFYETLSDSQLRQRPNTVVNSVIWCLFHVARSEDIGVNRLVTEGGQVADEDRWLERMNVPFRHFGIGMTGDEVTDFSRAINISALRKYHQEVGHRTAEILESSSAISFDQVLVDEHLRSVLEEEGAVRSAEVQNVFESYQGMTRGWALMHLGLTHTFQHIGEATTIASLIGVHR